MSDVGEIHRLISDGPKNRGRPRCTRRAGDRERPYVSLQRDPVRFPQFVADLHAAFGRLSRPRCRRE